MANVSLSDLRRHVPAVDEEQRVVACSCGWHLSGETDDLWLSWIEHLPGVVAGSGGNLLLTPADLRFLTACKITLKK